MRLGILRSIGKGCIYLLLIGVSVVAYNRQLFAETWSTPQDLTVLNSSDRETAGILTEDGNTMYFHSDRLGKGNIYTSNWNGTGWDTPIILPPPVNGTTSDEGKICKTADDRFFVFTSNRTGGFGGRDLYIVERFPDGVWGAAENLGANVNTANDDTGCGLSADGMRLVFTSDRPGGYGGRDLYQTRKVNGVWQIPVNLGPLVNTAKHEANPTVTTSGRYLFFSRFVPRDEDHDIYRYEYVGGEYVNPVLLPAPVNTVDDDVSSYFSECTAQFIKSVFISGPKWELQTSTWLDYPHLDTCTETIGIPEGEWRIRVTLLEASASLSSDVYIDQPIQRRMINDSLKNIGRVVQTPFVSGTEVVLFIRIGESQLDPGDVYDHYSNTEMAEIERINPFRFIVGFEDLPFENADFDYNDVVLLVELVGRDQFQGHSSNYFGERQTTESVSTVSGATVLQQPSSFTIIQGITTPSGAALTVPPNALVEDTFVTIVEGDPSLYDQVEVLMPGKSVGIFYKVEFTDGTTDLQPGALATLQLPYPDGDDDGIVDGTEVKEKKLVLLQLDIEELTWRALDSSVDKEANTVTALVDSVSFFALGTVPKAKDDEPPDFDLFAGSCTSIVSNDNNPGGFLLILIALVGIKVRTLRRRMDNGTV